MFPRSFFLALGDVVPDNPSPRGELHNGPNRTSRKDNRMTEKGQPYDNE